MIRRLEFKRSCSSPLLSDLDGSTLLAQPLTFHIRISPFFRHLWAPSSILRRRLLTRPRRLPPLPGSLRLHLQPSSLFLRPPPFLLYHLFSPMTIPFRPFFIRTTLIFIRFVIRADSSARIGLSAFPTLDSQDFFEECESQDALGGFGVCLFDQRGEAGFGVCCRETDEGLEGTCCQG